MILLALTGRAPTSEPPCAQRKGRANDAPDVAVIGGGIVGASAAAFLARAGARMELFERAELAAGASGRDSGAVQHPYDPELLGLHNETVAMYSTSTALPSTPSRPACSCLAATRRRWPRSPTT